MHGCFIAARRNGRARGDHADHERQQFASHRGLTGVLNARRALGGVLSLASVIQEMNRIVNPSLHGLPVEVCRKQRISMPQVGAISGTVSVIVLPSADKSACVTFQGAFIVMIRAVVGRSLEVPGGQTVAVRVLGNRRETRDR